MNDEYTDDQDLETTEDYTSPDEKVDALHDTETNDGDDVVVTQREMASVGDAAVDDDSDDTREGVFNDEDPNATDIDDEKHPYPHP